MPRIVGSPYSATGIQAHICIVWARPHMRPFGGALFVAPATGTRNGEKGETRSLQKKCFRDSTFWRQCHHPALPVCVIHIIWKLKTVCIVSWFLFFLETFNFLWFPSRSVGLAKIYFWTLVWLCSILHTIRHRHAHQPMVKRGAGSFWSWTHAAGSLNGQSLYFQIIQNCAFHRWQFH